MAKMLFLISEHECFVFLYQLLCWMWQSYLWHMNFFPSTSRVTSHSCWASRSCFNPEKRSRKGTQRWRWRARWRDEWVRIRQSRGGGDREGKASREQRWKDRRDYTCHNDNYKGSFLSSLSMSCLTMCYVVPQRCGAVIWEILLLWVAVRQGLSSSTVPILPWLGTPGDCAPAHSIHLRSSKHTNTEIQARELHTCIWVLVCKPLCMQGLPLTNKPMNCR